MIESALNTLLLDLYSCPTDCNRWLKVLDRIRAVLRVRCAAVQLLARSGDRVTVKWAIRDSESEADRAHHDPFVSGGDNPRVRFGPPAHLHQPEILLRDRDYAGHCNEEFARLGKRLAALGLGSFLAHGISVSNNEGVALVLHRDVNDSNDYSDEDEKLVTAVTPHLGRALSLAGRLEELRHQNNCLRQVMDRMFFGAVLCDEQSRPSWANHTAQETFATRAGIWLSRGRLAANSPADTDTLRRSIAQAAHEQTATGLRERCFLLSSTRGPGLQIMVVPLAEEAANEAHRGPSRPAPAAQREVLVLFSRQCESQILCPNVVATLFSLSPAESRLTVALCQGQTVNDYAAASGVSVGTARFQLKQVLAKTRTPRQSELVRRICTSIVAHARNPESGSGFASGRGTTQ